jgi:hypothetical protein
MRKHKINDLNKAQYMENLRGSWSPFKTKSYAPKITLNILCVSERSVQILGVSSTQQNNT